MPTLFDDVRARYDSAMQNASGLDTAINGQIQAFGQQMAERKPQGTIGDRITQVLAKRAPGLQDVTSAAVDAYVGGKSFGETLNAARAARLKEQATLADIMLGKQNAITQAKRASLEEARMYWQQMESMAQQGQRDSKAIVDAMGVLTGGDADTTLKLVQAINGSEGDPRFDVYAPTAMTDIARIMGIIGLRPPQPKAEIEKPLTEAGKSVYDRQLLARQYGENSPQIAAFDELASAKTKDKAPKLTDERGMRQEFTKLSEDFVKIRDSYLNIQTAAKNPSPANDISLVFAYMKLLDPDSVVRETEYATAENAAGVPVRVRTWFNKLLEGERLGDVQRADFVSAAENIFRNNLNQQRALEQNFRGLAERSEIEPDQVVIDFVGQLRPQEQGGATLSFGRLSTEELGSIDLTTLNAEQLQEYLKEMDSRGFK